MDGSIFGLEIRQCIFFNWTLDDFSCLFLALRAEHLLHGHIILSNIFKTRANIYVFHERILKLTLLFAVQVVVLWQTVYVVTAFCLWGAVEHLQRLWIPLYTCYYRHIQNSTLKNTEPSLYTTTWMCQNIHTPKCRPKCTNMEIPVYIFLSHIQLFTEK